ncbi:MAG: TRAP transporter small permease subunit, partial [Planctomycetota bacterium]|jgi:TRAP-type C4-dicarboxylate transport system permease small subunit|nr:TRAP transporter small permease subunit [Planctomycetota bacterium]
VCSSDLVRQDCHIGFDLAVRRLPPRGRKIMGLVNNALFIIYLAVMAWLTWGLMQRYVRFNSATPILRINYFWARLPMLIGCLAGILRLLIRQYQVLTNRFTMYAGDAGGEPPGGEAHIQSPS